MIVTAVPVVGRGDAHILPQVVRVPLENGLFVAVLRVQDSKTTHTVMKRCVEVCERYARQTLADIVRGMTRLQQHEPHLVSLAVLHILNEAKEAAQVSVLSFGDAEVRLLRGPKQGVLVSQPELRVRQGSVSIGDVYILATSDFWHVVQLPSVPVSNTLGEDLAVQLASSEQRLGVAAVVVTVGEMVLSSNAATSESEMVHSSTPFHQVPAEFAALETSQEKVKQEVEVLAAQSVLHDQHLPAELIQPEPQESEGVSSVVPARTMRFVVPTLSRKTKVILVAITLLLLALSVGWSWRVHTQREQEKKIQAVLQEPRQQLQQAKAVAATDPVTARQQVATIQTTVTQLEQHYPANDPARASISQFLQEVKTYANEVSGQRKLSTLTPLYNLQLVKADFRASAVSVRNGVAYFTDSRGGAPIQLQLESKQASFVPTTQTSGIAQVVAGNKGVYVVANGVERDGKEVFAADGDWGAPGPAAWYGSNLYVVQKNTSQLRKFTGADRAWSPLAGGANWLKPETEANVGTWTSLAIDGRIWVGTSDGQIVRYLQGVKDSFRIKGLEPALRGAVWVGMPDQGEVVYVLEPAGARLLQLKKTGEFVQAWLAADFVDATAFAIDPNGKTAYVVAGALVYTIPLE